MNFSRSTRKALSLATLAVISAIGVSACVVTDSGYYEEDYYPEERTVIVKRPAPVVQTVEVYETRPTVIVAPRPYRHHHNYYYSSPRPTRPVIIHQRPQYQTEQKVILNPGRHQQQEVIIKSHHGHRPYNNETHRVSPTSATEVKQPKKIVIESQGEAPPSTLAQ